MQSGNSMQFWVDAAGQLNSMLECSKSSIRPMLGVRCLRVIVSECSAAGGD